VRYGVQDQRPIDTDCEVLGTAGSASAAGVTRAQRPRQLRIVLIQVITELGE